jgi:hypothetical protein
VGERSHANDATYRQQKKRSKTYEESLLEIIKEKLEMILMKTNLFSVSDSDSVVQKVE